jgi:phosphopantothenate-cysteine ligase
MKVLLTSGGTKVPIDAVRHIGNMSRGTFGRNIATRGLTNGWDLDFVYAEGSRAPHKMEIDVGASMDTLVTNIVDMRRIIGVGMYHPHSYKDFAEYQMLLNYEIDHFKPDVIVLAAAVSDYGTVPVNGKIRSKDNLTIHLEPLPKLIAGIKKRAPNAMLVGFKLLVDSTDDELVAEATKSIINNGCDLVVANDLRDIRNGKHKVILVSIEDTEVHTDDCAGAVANKISEMWMEKR